jgi:hypothetical protein
LDRELRAPTRRSWVLLRSAVQRKRTAGTGDHHSQSEHSVYDDSQSERGVEDGDGEVDDAAAVRALQQRFLLRPLSAWLAGRPGACKVCTF